MSLLPNLLLAKQPLQSWRRDAAFWTWRFREMVDGRPFRLFMRYSYITMT
jgi:hypothetical protein